MTKDAYASFVNFYKEIKMKSDFSHFKEFFLKKKDELEKKISERENIQLESSDLTDLIQNQDLKRNIEIFSKRQNEALIKIQIALTKIEKGTFGSCDECGEEISEKRLQIVPDCSFCISCAEGREIKR